MKTNWKEEGFFDGIDLTLEKEAKVSSIFDEIVDEIQVFKNACFCVVLRLAKKRAIT
jgi:hypothetical protein